MEKPNKKFYYVQTCNTCGKEFEVKKESIRAYCDTCIKSRSVYVDPPFISIYGNQ